MSNFFLRILIISLFVTSFLFAQPESIPYHFDSIGLNSGIHNGQKRGMKHIIAFGTEIQINNAAWLRLIFGETELSSNSYILITSIKDDIQQKLDTKSLKGWNNTSAFFNGNRLKIELYVAAKDSGVFVKVEKIMVGEYNSIDGISTICGSEDNRTSSNHPAIGRIVPEGCTGWIPAAGVLVTAGHCAGSDAQVIEFNVPASLSDGTIQHPDSRDQYTINQGTWNFTNVGIGNDWAVFRVNNNSITGQQPIQAQDSYFLVNQNFSDSLRVTGYGVDGPAPYFGAQGGTRNSDNQTQQTHSGPNSGSSGTTVKYQVDTQGGNSGSPIIDEYTQNAIGVHTNGGCTSSGGYNSGTSTYNTSFWNAITFNINLSSAQFLEPGTGGSYLVNGTDVGGTFSGRGGIIQATPPPNFIFMNWNDGSVNNPKFLTENTTDYAVFKGHLLTSTQSATSSGNQRKIAKDYNGTLHMVYASLNKIWYTYSTDGGSTWSVEEQISGSGSASTPCIASSDGPLGYDVYFVWQEVVGSTNYLYIKSLNYLPSTILDSDPSGSDIQPSIAVSTDEDKILIVYKKMYSGRYQIHYRYSSDHGSNFSVGGPLSIGTPIIWDLPSAAWNPQQNKFMVSTSYSSSFLTTDLISYDGTTWAEEGNVYYSNQVPSTPSYSQVAVDGTGRTHVTWIAYDNYYGEGSAAMHRSMLNGNWSTISLFRDEIIYNPSIVYTSVCGHNDADGGTSIFYAPGSDQVLFNIYSTNNSSWNGLIYIAPSAPISYTIPLEKALPQTVSFVTVKGSSLPYSIINQTKNNSQSGTYSGTLKIMPGNETVASVFENTKLYRRMELIDTTTGSILTVQFGNIKGKSIDFPKPDILKSNNLFSSFMNTFPFSLTQDDTLSVEFGVNNKGWKKNTKVIFELVDSYGKVIQKIDEHNFSKTNTTSGKKEKINKIVNRLQNASAALRVRIDELDSNQLVVNYMDVILLNSSDEELSSNLPKSITQIGEVPGEYKLEQNYPNPFNPSTVIDFSIPRNGLVSLKIYDLLGREITALVDEHLSAGNYSVDFNTSALPNSSAALSSGVYFYVLKSNGFTLMKKMILLK